MKKELIRKDFKKRNGYFSYKGKHCEICLEPCLNGFDIAVYNLNQSLLEPKFCTDLKESFSTKVAWDVGKVERYFKFWQLVDKEVNEFYKKYELKRGGEND